jgi:hypothetical protein
MTELERCRLALLKAEEAYDELKNKRYWECSRAISEAKERIESELSAKYSEEQSRLHEAARAARQAYETAKLAEANASLPFPVGTKLIGWIRRKLSSFRCGPLEKKSLGVVEVCDKNTEIPKGIVYHRPDIGDVLVRLLKKDGTPGKAVEKYNGDGWRTHIWLPEGEKPKDS